MFKILRRQSKKMDGKPSEQASGEGSGKRGSLFGLRLGGRSDKTPAEPVKSKSKKEKVEQKGLKDNLVPTGTVSAGPSDSVRALLRTAIADAEQIAASIKVRAQAEAEAEAARIIAQANLEAEEIKGKAKIAAQGEAESVLSEANKKADIVEVEAKQRALQFLLRASEEMGKEVQEEYRSVYSRLSSSLKSIMDEARSIEGELAGKTAKLLETRGLQMKGYDAVLLGTSGATQRSEEAVAEKPEEVAYLPKETVEEIAEELTQLAEEVARYKAEEAVQLPEEAAEEKAEEAVQLPEEAAEEKAEEAVQLPEEAVEEKAEEVAQLPEEAVEEKAEEVAQLPEEAAEEKAEEVAQLPEEAAEEKAEEPEVTLIEMDKQAIYTGEIELVIASTVELKLVSRFYNYLQKIPELRVLYTRGSWDKGTIIAVVLEKPMPVLKLISETPGMKITPQPFEKDGSASGVSGSLPRGGEQRMGRIRLFMKEA